jgi:hypothetical protein
MSPECCIRLLLRNKDYVGVGSCGIVFIPCKPISLESTGTNFSRISCVLLVKHVGCRVVFLVLSHISQGDDSYKKCVKFDWISLDLIEFDVGYVDYSSGRKEINIQLEVEI